MARVLLRRQGKRPFAAGIVALSLALAITSCDGDKDNDDAAIVAVLTKFNKALGFDSNVSALAPDGDGSGDIYVGGSFILYGATIVDRIARLGATGASK